MQQIQEFNIILNKCKISEIPDNNQKQELDI